MGIIRLKWPNIIPVVNTATVPAEKPLKDMEPARRPRERIENSISIF